MLTLTVRHHASLTLAETTRVVTQAWRRLRKQGSVSRPWTQHVQASVRALEITHGANGWHPHIHVLVRLSGDHVPRALRELDDHWRLAVQRAGGDTYVPEHGIGVRWSRAREASGEIAARYAAKLGWEATGSGKPHDRSPWAILERAAMGDQRAASLWDEYVTATKGRRAVELDDRAAAAACRARFMRCAGDATQRETEETSGSSSECVKVEREQIGLLRRYEAVSPAAMDLLLRDAETMGAARALADWLARAEAWERARWRSAA